MCVCVCLVIGMWEFCLQSKMFERPCSVKVFGDKPFSSFYLKYLYFDFVFEKKFCWVWNSRWLVALRNWKSLFYCVPAFSVVVKFTTIIFKVILLSLLFYIFTMIYLYLYLVYCFTLSFWFMSYHLIYFQLLSLWILSFFQFPPGTVDL